MLTWLRDLFLPRDLEFRIPPIAPLQVPPETRVRVYDRDRTAHHVGTLTGLHTGDDGRARARVVFTDPVRKSWMADASLHRISLVPG